MSKKGTGIVATLGLAAVGAAARYLVPEAIPDRESQRRALPRGEPKGRGTHVSDTRGRKADSPAEIPALGWKDIAWRTYEQIGKDRLLAISAGVVFYGLLALFPAITALVAMR